MVKIYGVYTERSRSRGETTPALNGLAALELGFPGYNPPMDFNDFRRLLAPDGQAALQAAEALAPREEDYLRGFQELEPPLPC